MRRKVKPTLAAIEMDRGEVEEVELVSGDVVRIELVSTAARVLRTTLRQPKVEEKAGRADYSFTCVLRINGREHSLEREVSTPRSFYAPWVIDLKVHDYGETILLDPWILFWQIYKDTAPVSLASH